jgi:hypothetical protein
MMLMALPRNSLLGGSLPWAEAMPVAMANKTVTTNEITNGRISR